MAEFLMNFLPGHEDVLVIHGGVGIRGRDHMAVNAGVFQIGKEFRNFLHVRLLVNRGVGTDHKTRVFGGLDAIDGLAENAFALHAEVVRDFHAVQVDIEEELLAGCELL